MNKHDDCAIFQDLYELYIEEEVEEETKLWMEEHEASCTHCVKDRTAVATPSEAHEDSEKIWGIRVLTMTMYGCFIALSVWMSIWYFW